MGFFYMAAFLGALMGVALPSLLVISLSDPHFYYLVRLHHLSLQLFNPDELEKMLHGASSLRALQAVAGRVELIAVIKASFVYWLKTVMWINVGLMCVALYLCHWLKIGLDANQLNEAQTAPCKK